MQSVAGSALTYDNAGRILTGTDQLSVGWTAFGKPYEIARTVEGQSHLADFWYDPEHTRYKQVVDGTEQISLEGGAYRIIHALSGPDTTYQMAILVGGAVIGEVQTSTNTAETGKIHYFYKDNLGSITVIADGTGQVTQRLAYGPYGTKRDATNWNNPLSIVAILALNIPTDRGFTGQHDLTGMKLVDYGGRIYDLETGRFLSPDPTGAEENPYAYVQNNPESGIDPTGYFGILDVVKVAAVIYLSVVTAGAASAYFGSTILGGASGGFVAGFVGSGGNLRAGALGAIGGAAFAAIGGVKGLDMLGKGFTEGAVGGLLSEAGGGRFSDGFLGAFASATAGTEIDVHLPGDSAGAEVARVAAHAALGGTVSRLNGGSFANGAESAAFQALFNEGLHSSPDPSPLETPIKKGDVWIGKDDAAKVLKAVAPKNIKGRISADNVTLADQAKAQQVLAAMAAAEKQSAYAKALLHGYLSGIASGNAKDMAIDLAKGTIKVV